MDAQESSNQFGSELRALINRHCLENESDTPDYVLADYLCECLGAFQRAVAIRRAWWGGKTR
jgi:hypothetical protein